VNAPEVATGYALEDRYLKDAGRAYVNGMQALVRLLLVQHRRDRATGLNTAGFVSGYRGSPLGTLDMALWQAGKHLAAEEIRFEPGVNEDLAATAIWGTQQASLMEPTHDGVFAMWYGKGPGTDRSCDALKHGNYNGTSQNGGVLVVAGDDPGGKSSSLPHQSEPALIHCGIPVLSPADLQEMLDFGLLGWAMSRYSGCWIGFRCVTDLLDSSGVVDISIDRVKLVIPKDSGATDRWIKWSSYPLVLEKGLVADRLPAVHRFARANGLDRVAFGAARPRLGIVTAGKTYGDVRQALERLGIDKAEAERIGLAVYKLGLTWPIEPEGLRGFAQKIESLLVVEEKRPLIEDQIAALLYAEPERPRLFGKRDETGTPLVAADGELNPDRVMEALARWLQREPLVASAAIKPALSAALLRLPAFCSGCPHNTSTRIPEGSYALAGIGCHGMALMLPERRTLAYTHMGAEGSNWIGLSPFSRQKHIFQNMGDGTYNHSGSLAIRAAVAAKANITYKILVNGAVAMTGGQPIEGHPELDVRGVTQSIAHQLAAEGVARVVVVTDYPERLAGADLPPEVNIHHRDEMDSLQRELREIKGVTAILFDQACAAETRRLRKRGRLVEPNRRLFIHELVCEGCGDCSVQSNCIAVEPVETEFGRKRAINQDACNKDYSCLNGYCPSFAVLDGAKLKHRTAERGLDAPIAQLPTPRSEISGPYRILITGIGGTGVVTLGALLGVAAHLEGRACKILDQTGATQKNGAVCSHVQIAAEGDQLHATRITEGGADLVIGCDLVTTASLDALARMAAGRTKVIVNRDVAPTAQLAGKPDLDLGASPLEAAVAARVGTHAVSFVEATALARKLLGDDIGTNMLLLGVALQRGLLGVSAAALERAIELNGAKVEFNKRALALGRLCGHDMTAVRAASGNLNQTAAPESWQALVKRRGAFLVSYQDAAYAARYHAFVDRVAQRETEVMGTAGPLALAAANSYFKLLAYKDEYEVARLWTDPNMRAKLDEVFEPGYKVWLSLAPQIAGLAHSNNGRLKKRLWGPWVFVLLRILAAMRRLRGTPLDICGSTVHRRRERALIAEYERTMEQVLGSLTRQIHELAVEIASLPQAIRGYGVVKDRSIEAAKRREIELLARLGNTQGDAARRAAA
jgi:indolepyruvate ferredoxin oxidoreductase